MNLHCKKKNQVESLLPIQMELSQSWNGAPILPYKIAMELELYLNSISSNHIIPTAPGLSLQLPARPTTTPPHHEAFLFVQCSLSQRHNYLTNKKLHHHHELH